jgi:glycosyltransferase involved in cell wall biosynthesis
MKILFLSRWYPYPPDNGSKIRILNLLRHLSAQHQVDLISFASEPVDEAQIAPVQHFCRRVEVVPYRPFQPDRLKALMGFFAVQPRSVIDTFNADLQQRVDQAHRERSFDLVIASQIDMAPYALRVTGAAKIFEEIELTTLYEQFARQAHPLKKARGGLTWWKSSHYTVGLLKKFDGCTVVSEAERERVWQLLPKYQPIAIVPNGVNVAGYRNDFGSPEADTLIYSGALTYHANFDAVDFFLREIFPLVQAQRPQIKLRITGKVTGVPIERLPKTSSDSVVFTGYLPDIRSAIAQSWISIVPLRLGGGTRLKILEALALGTPVIATSKGAEGLNLAPERDILLADSPTDFAAAILRLLEDPHLRARLSRNGRLAVETKYDWTIIGQQFNTFIETAAAQAKPDPQLAEMLDFSRSRC